MARRRDASPGVMSDRGARRIDRTSGIAHGTAIEMESTPRSRSSPIARSTNPGSSREKSPRTIPRWKESTGGIPARPGAGARTTTTSSMAAMTSTAARPALRMRRMGSRLDREPTAVHVEVDEAESRGQERRGDPRPGVGGPHHEEAPSAARAADLSAHRPGAPGDLERALGVGSGDFGREAPPLAPFGGKKAGRLVEIAADERPLHLTGDVGDRPEAAAGRRV